MPNLDDGLLDDLGLILLLIIGLALILEECLPLLLLLLLRRLPLFVLLLVSHHREDTGLLHLIGSGRQRVPLDQSHLLKHSLNGVEHKFVRVIDEVEGGCREDHAHEQGPEYRQYGIQDGYLLGREVDEELETGFLRICE